MDPSSSDRQRTGTLPAREQQSRPGLSAAILADIARGYDEGRLLLIFSTDLGARLPVRWNIGAIAKRGHPGALEVVRRILLASASVPGAFPPVMFDIELNGQRYHEMHFGGRAFAQLFLYPAALGERRRRNPSASWCPIGARCYSYLSTPRPVGLNVTIVACAR